MSTARKSKAVAKLKERESGFDLNSISHAKVNEYNALHDPNMRHFFENPNVQKQLYETGQIDKYGRVINLEKNKSKLHILEREFKEAERMEEARHKEEMEMRYRVQRKRFMELERTRKLEKLEQIKEDKRVNEEVVRTMKSTTSGYSRQGSSFTRGLNETPMTSSGFFVTEEPIQFVLMKHIKPGDMTSRLKFEFCNNMEHLSKTNELNYQNKNII
eukprot:gene1700-3294_t